MGADGGSIPTRVELVRTKKKPEKKDKNCELAAKWRNCSLTQQPLRRPIMACQLGRLYNKEAVLELLLDRSTFETSETAHAHLRSIKDVKELNLTDNPAFKQDETEKAGSYYDAQAPYICPVVGCEMNGKVKFSYLIQCGCALSDKALRKVRSDVCLKCGSPYTEADIVVLNPEPEEEEVAHQRMLVRKEAARAQKKAKKHKINGEASQSGPVGERPSSSSSVTKGGDVPKSDKARKDVPVGGRCEPKPKSRKTIQDDPSASRVYKSLFTTSEEALTQAKGHWVTHNPQYY